MRKRIFFTLFSLTLVFNPFLPAHLWGQPEQIKQFKLPTDKFSNTLKHHLANQFANSPQKEGYTVFPIFKIRGNGDTIIMCKEIYSHIFLR